MNEIPQNGAPSGPNVIVRTLARWGVSIRTKLVVAFLGGTVLMVGLALSGLIALQRANDRTIQLIADQDRIALYQELDSAFSSSSMISLGAAYLTPERAAEAEMTWMKAPSAALVSRVGEIQVLLGRSMRLYGREGSRDRPILTFMRTEASKLSRTVRQIDALRKAGDLNAVQELVEGEFLPVSQRLQRYTYTTIQQIEATMAETAKTTALAYDRSRNQLIASAAVAVGLALLLAYVISASVTWPVRRIGQALGKIAGGDFQARVSVPNRDEFGGLATNVNVTSGRLGALYNEVESQRAELAEWNTALENKVALQVGQIERTNRLRRFLPAQVADLIVGAIDGENMLASKRSEVTVVFTDLRGFTAYSNAVSPERLIEALNAFHAASGPLIEASGGTLERFLGDGLMVVFGAPVQLENAADCAVNLARDLQNEFRPALAPFQTTENSLGLGIGIATGSATLGQIGFKNRLDYAAIGPTPNLAARLCDHAIDGQTLLCDATARAIETDVSPAGTFSLKGIGEDIPAFKMQPREGGL